MSVKASICISAFNKPILLKNTLDSIFCQKPPFIFEVIITDDGSRDGEVTKVCKDYPVKCVRIDREPLFRNPCVGRNTSYRAAVGEVIIAQSDEVLHITPNAIELLVKELVQGTFIIANVFGVDKIGRRCSVYSGPTRKVPYFFLGALYRKDLYAIGGNDEDFIVSPASEDAWFADCLMKGLNLTPVYTTRVVGHHQWHPYYTNIRMEVPTKILYKEKREQANSGKIPWCSAGGPWSYTEMNETEKIFTDFYKKQEWGDEESKKETVSGTGSTLKATERLRNILPHIFSSFGITSLLDLPCGDYNWMKHVNLKDMCYIGADIVKSLVEDNKQKYPGVNFECLDLLTSDLPTVDCLLCRDCLVHLSNEDLLKALVNIRYAGIKYLLTTTFPQKTNDKIIKTGEWTPYNLQAPPFNFPAPIFLAEEGCTEFYPHFADKSIALWEVRELEKVLFPTKSITICVDFDDFLAITLPRNMKHFSKTLVVTTIRDHRTQFLCNKLGIDYYVTDVFYKNRAAFNKGAAMEEGFDVLGRDGWICIWDADIVMPNDIFVWDKDPSCLYSVDRLLLEDPTKFSDDLNWNSLSSPSLSFEFSGYFQLFHASALKTKPWYTTTWAHAGGADSDFQKKFSGDKCKRLSFQVLHLGEQGVEELGTRIGRNWRGRVTPRIDTGEIPIAANIISEEIRQMAARRDVDVLGALKTEKIKIKPDSESRIPKQISFFWTGKMSWLRWLTLHSFRAYNPDWRINLFLYKEDCGEKQWQSGEQDDVGYEGFDYREKLEGLGLDIKDYICPIKNLPAAQVSDIFQWEILGSLGGCYADMDFLWVKSLNDLWNSFNNKDAVFCLERGFPAIGFLASAVNCGIFRDIFEFALQGDPKDYQGYGTSLLNRLYGQKMRHRRRFASTPGTTILSNIKTRYTGMSIVDIPDYTMYPLDWRESNVIFNQKVQLHRGAVGLHWFGGAPLSQTWNQLLTPENWKQYDSTFTSYLQELLK